MIKMLNGDTVTYDEFIKMNKISTYRCADADKCASRCNLKLEHIAGPHQHKTDCYKLSRYGTL